MFGAGIVGFFMRLYGFSPAALVLALVLGPLAEEALAPDADDLARVVHDLR